jgi:hypothetical protein
LNIYFSVCFLWSYFLFILFCFVLVFWVFWCFFGVYFVCFCFISLLHFRCTGIVCRTAFVRAAVVDGNDKFFYGLVHDAVRLTICLLDLLDAMNNTFPICCTNQKYSFKYSCKFLLHSESKHVCSSTCNTTQSSRTTE